MQRRVIRTVPWIILGLAAVWALRVFASPLAVGGGDARWYSMMLADWVTQVRAGSFPVWVGQTEFAFNGAVSPLRVAPLYQHWAGALDLLTGHTLGIYALQNLTILTLGVAGIWSAYAVLTGICPRERVLAALCSVMYLFSPGVLILVSVLDLQMTWAAIPFLPWLFGGLWRFPRESGPRRDWAIAWPLAALWWAHPPTALWATILTSLYVGVVWLRGPWRESVGSIARCAAFGGLLMAFTLAAQVSLHLPGSANAALSPLSQPNRIMESVRAAYPGALLPLTPLLDTLGDQQLGYTLWVLLLGVLVVALWKREFRTLVLAGSLFGLLMLVLPVQGATAWAWRVMPSVVTRITYYWPMQRIYVIVAAGTVVIGFAMMTRFLGSLRSRSIIVALAILGCGWSSYEAGHLASAARARRMNPEDSAHSFLPENRYLTRFAYGQFPGLPDRFSAGVMEPWNEFRLKDSGGTEGSFQPIGSPEREGTWSWSAERGSNVWRADSTVILEPNRDYLLEVVFPSEDYSGILQLRGHRLYREYALPESGQPRAFGCAKASDHSIAFRISGVDREELGVRFISSSVLPRLEPWTFRVWRRDPTGPGVIVRGLMPAVMTVRSRAGGQLVTPRMYLKGYSATVDAKPVGVERQNDGELAIPVPAGDHEVVLSYSPPHYLAIAYWLSVGTAIAGGIVAFATRSAPGGPDPTGQTTSPHR